MNAPAASTAVLLIAHGSRRAEANRDLEVVADELRRTGHYGAVQTSYLELAEPTIPEGARRCVAALPDIKTVLMMPYFLSAGVHVTGDLLEHRDALSQEFPGVGFVLCPHLGLHPLMFRIVEERLNEGLAQTPASRNV